MAENWKSCFEEELLCPICLQVFVEPVQLPCKHNFCRACIGEAWGKESVSRCPECNNVYPQKPALEKNLKLSNIVEKFNSFTADAAAVAATTTATSAAAAAFSSLYCRYCRNSPAQKVCLRCDTGCCQSHVGAHLQAASVSGSHLLIEAGDARAWSCAQHDAYRLLHCETDQVAVCRYCYYMGSHHGHSICDLEVRRNEIREVSNIINKSLLLEVMRCGYGEGQGVRGCGGRRCESRGDGCYRGDSYTRGRGGGGGGGGGSY